MISDYLQKVTSGLGTVTPDFMQLHDSVELGPVALGPAAPKTVMVVWMPPVENKTITTV